MTLIRYGCYPPDPSTPLPHDSGSAMAYAQGLVTGRDVHSRFLGAAVEDVAAKVSHEELVHYLAYPLLKEPGVQWDYFAFDVTDIFDVTTKRRLYVPRLGESIDLDAVALLLTSKDPQEVARGKELANSIVPPEDPSSNPTRSLWEEKGAPLTKCLQPLADQVRARAQDLCDRWAAQAPVPGFCLEEFWSRENLNALWKEGKDISDGDLMLYFLGWFLGLRAGKCSSGIAGHLGFFPLEHSDGAPGLMLMYYVPATNNLTSPLLFAGVRQHELAPEAWWDLMHYPKGWPEESDA